MQNKSECFGNRVFEGKAYAEKSSRFHGFIAQTKSIPEFNDFLKAIKTKHKKAKHNCYAYVINEEVEGAQISLFNERIRKEKYSNDGEPSGCGNTLLGLLRQNKLENYAIIVSRYFGGTLLGSGNLIRAYATAGKYAIQAQENTSAGKSRQ